MTPPRAQRQPRVSAVVVVRPLKETRRSMRDVQISFTYTDEELREIIGQAALEDLGSEHSALLARGCTVDVRLVPVKAS